MADTRLRATERWFYRRGLPFLVEDYRSSTNVWTRAVALQRIWMDGAAPVDLIWEWGQGYGVTRQLMRVSLFLAAFSGFYVTIYTAIDATYREHFYDRIRMDLERSLSVRRAYVLLFRRG